MRNKYNVHKTIVRVKNKSNLLISGAAVGLAGLLMTVVMPIGAKAAVGGPTCNVPSDYATIQAAVDDTGCATVKVAPGTYNESLVINRSLNLKGAKAGTDARNRNGNNESIINKLDDNTANITITADNVTVDGFTLNGPASGGTASLVMQTGNSGETVKNNIFNNPGRAASITTSNTTFTQNVVNNTPTSSDGFQANSTPVHDVTISDNNFSGADQTVYNADITLIEGNSNITVKENRSNGDGTLVALFKTNGAQVKDNNVVGANLSSAIYIGGANSNVKVSGNKVTGAGTGVNIANDFGDGVNSNITITDNNLRNNGNGIKIRALATSADNTVVAHQNQLVGNTTDGFNNLGTFNANATCNYWGSKSGPGSVGPGTGDKVTAYVAFASWAKNSDAGCDTANASGDLRLANPSQRIVFNVTEKQDITKPQGTVQYWNFDYPGGLNYKATVTCAYINPQTNEARFMFQIPSGFPGLSGQYVVAYVKEVKHGQDLYGHAASSDQATATQWCENGVGFSPTMYTVTKGDVDIED